MKIQRLAVALTVANLVLLLLTVTQAGSISRDVVTPTLRTQVLELVDDSGQIRSRLEVKPGGEVLLSSRSSWEQARAAQACFWSTKQPVRCADHSQPERHGGDDEDHRHYDDEQEWPAASDHALPANKALHSTIVTMSLVGCA